ncbi:helix-turn-helix domain-containing protein [Pseudoflavonifractor sp. BIOML-A6]|nr:MULTISPECIES: Crp/Fnr family transcriptional regulator [unclassified Pseudoflavonifractor]MTQ95867.1 helix-turn-helix domain-containing protein [Pseudoflavonifractor sp. BIOML-A16]MTR04619.1 helix-turn-helix domain-containing protein [Pseudoflavonifractor sp. BIOML-A15]MTR31133.1 helix-turn-helix domain-containing protein [Pseudoflavonifractor sp. BIOML-A14]MTR71698.1 helix-turn-helix domain-containing protein [Pseudoflavonifractor sp. BIOML-A18]MTS62759.1 helix-turn-helix domain-containing
MRAYLSLLRATTLMQGLTDREIEDVLRCLSAVERPFGKGETLFRTGEPLRVMGLVLEGLVCLEKVDFWGNRSLLAQAGPGEIFGEVYACEPGRPLHIDVAAGEAGKVLLLDVERVLTTCTNACPFHARLIRNLLGVVARRAYSLSRKLEHISGRTTRAKLLSYLSEQAERTGSSRFSIPFSRQELADYLAVERSAMSAELGKLRREGILSFEKNCFELL